MCEQRRHLGRTARSALTFVLLVNMRLYRACLQAGGWVRTKESDPPPPGFFRGFE
jgi:hypothetical protein